MPSVWAKKYIDEAIELGYVPLNLQNNYQNPITREEFAEIFVTTVFSDFGESVENYKPIHNEAWDANKSIIDNFLDKVETTEYFTDTENKYIKVANMLGIVNGSGDHKFNPSDLLTREQAAVMVVNYYQSILISHSSRAEEVFEDYNNFSTWAKNSVSIAYEHEIIKGTREMKHDGHNITGKGYCDAKGKLTREQAILIISKASKSNYNKNVLYLRGLVGSKIEELVSGYKIDGNTIVMNEIKYIALEDDESNSNEDIVKDTETESKDTSDNLPIFMKFPYHDADRESINAAEIKVFRGNVVKLVNTERANVNLDSLVYNEDLEAIAQMRAQDMAERDYFSHISPDGNGFLDLITEFDIELYKTFRNSGENILKGSIHTTPEGAMLSWMGSNGYYIHLIKRWLLDMHMILILVLLIGSNYSLINKMFVIILLEMLIVRLVVSVS